jgi:hypothetical protein
MPTEKRSTTFRLSEDARAFLEQLAVLHGISQTAVLEMAIRQMARHDLPAFQTEDTSHGTTADKKGKKRK